MVLDNNQKVSGYAAVSDDDEEYSIDFYAHPNCKDIGVAGYLMSQCDEYIQRQVSAMEASETSASVIVSNVNKVDIEAVEKSGFQLETYYFRMQIELDSRPSQPTFPDNSILSTFSQSEDVERIYDFIQNAFARPGYTPPKFERWRDYMMREDHFDSDLWILLEYQGELVGAALCYSYPEHGWVRQLGVAPAWRRQGIGSSLLQQTFQMFYGRGQHKIALGMNSENANAYQLYERVGMKKVRQFDEYSKLYASG